MRAVERFSIGTFDCLDTAHSQHLRIRGLNCQNVMVFDEPHLSASARLHLHISGQNSFTVIARMLCFTRCSTKTMHPFLSPSLSLYTCVYAGRICAPWARPCFLQPTLVERGPFLGLLLRIRRQKYITVMAFVERHPPAYPCVYAGIRLWL